MGSTSQDLPQEARGEVNRFFVLGIDRLVRGGLQLPVAVQVLATLEGATLVANVMDDPAMFEHGTASLV
jgi:TetR/AcrR family transcriptional repressor of nem operon